MQTMFVTSPPSSPSRSSALAHNYHPRPASPLKPLHCNILAASESCLQLQWPDAPASTYESPLHKHFRSVLGQSTLPLEQACKDLFSNYTRPEQQARMEREGRQGRDATHNGWREDDKADATMFCSNSNARTRAAFKPQRSQKGTNSWQLKQFAEATLGSGSLRKVVKLPEGEDKDEWLAVNGLCCVDYIRSLNLRITKRRMS